MSQDAATCRDFDVHKIDLQRKCGKLLIETAGVLGSGSKSGGGNSGFQALNLAVQFGAKRIILVGFDMRLDHGVHWHGPHQKGLNNPREPNLAPWRDALNGAAALLAALGVEVLNASPISALTAYPKVNLREAVGC